MTPSSGRRRGDKRHVPPEVRALVGAQLREARHGAGLAIGDVARAGVTDGSTLSGIESGRVSISLGMIYELTQHYGVPLWWVFYEPPPPGQGERSATRDRWRGAGGVRRGESLRGVPRVGEAGEAEEEEP